MNAAATLFAAAGLVTIVASVAAIYPPAAGITGGIFLLALARGAWRAAQRKR